MYYYFNTHHFNKRWIEYIENNKVHFNLDTESIDFNYTSNNIIVPICICVDAFSVFLESKINLSKVNIQ